MKAIVYRRYGGPEVLQVEEVETPSPSPTGLLVRIHATTVSTAEMAMRKGEPFFARLISGLRRPRNATIPGSELAGVVTEVGADVTAYRPGDRVVASTGAKLGANAEYIGLEGDGAIAPIPDGATYEDAVAVCEGGLTALPFLRDGGQIREGHRVLINGASGGVGTAAVQLAKAYGAHVTAVCSASGADLVRSLGADEVIDYREVDPLAGGRTYDIVFDVAGTLSFARSRQALTDHGRYLRTVPSAEVIWSMLRTARGSGRRASLMFTGLRGATDKAADLALLMDLLRRGSVRAVVGRAFALSDSVDAHRFVESGRKQGTVVLTVP